MNPDLTPPNPSGKCMCGCGENAPIAPYTSSRFGWMKGHPKKYIYGHWSRTQTRAQWSDDLWAAEERGYRTPCHIFLGSKDRLGYGRFNSILAHRFSYERAKGPIPDGLTLDHLCRVSSCINPDHLDPVTHRENMLRGNGTKINFAIAEEMREMYARGMTQREIATVFGVEKRTVWRVTSGRDWTHDPTPNLRAYL